MQNIERIIKALSKNIEEKAETLFEHKGDIGTSREKSFISFLKAVFPGKYGLSSGEVFDKNGDGCGQVDVVIYDNHFTTSFSDESGNLLVPAEESYGIIEVKSTLDSDALEKTKQKFKKYNSLYRKKLNKNQIRLNPERTITLGPGIQLMANETHDYDKPFNLLFAYESNISSETFLEKLPENTEYDLIIVPNKFCFVGRRRGFGVNGGGKNMQNWLIEGEKSLLVGMLYLYMSLPNIHIFKRDWSPDFLAVLEGFLKSE